MYWLGVIAILLIVFSGIMADSAKDPAAPPEDTAGAAKESPPDLLSAIPLFWIGIFVLANLSWRVMCETCAVVLPRPDLPCAPLPMETPAAAPLLEDMAPAVGAGEPGGSVECPRCGKVVPSGEQKTCEICGVQGCSSCIRLTGLLKKKWTCRDCFERK
jgi:hypothetical protein